MVDLVSVRQMFLEGKDESFNIWLSKIERLDQTLEVLTADKYPVMFGESERKGKWESGQGKVIPRTSMQRYWLFSNGILKASYTQTIIHEVVLKCPIVQSVFLRQGWWCSALVLEVRHRKTKSTTAASIFLSRESHTIKIRMLETTKCASGLGWEFCCFYRHAHQLCSIVVVDFKVQAVKTSLPASQLGVSQTRGRCSCP